MKKICGWIFLLAFIGSTTAVPAGAQEDNAAELAKKLANPVASLISVPLQYNYDGYGGQNDGASVSRLNIQPVIPISLNAEWSLITRTILPLLDQRGFPSGEMNESGLGDTTASQFFSPKAPTAGGWIWGAGPVELLPTATDKFLGSGKWGLGPTAVALNQQGPWSVGILANHIWSVAGNSNRPYVNSTFLQPFVSYVTKTHTTIGVNTEATYDWKSNGWAVPVNVQVGQMFKIGPQICQLVVGGRYWAESPDDGPDGWGLRVQLTLLFPK